MLSEEEKALLSGLMELFSNVKDPAKFKAVTEKLLVGFRLTPNPDAIQEWDVDRDIQEIADARAVSEKADQECLVDSASEGAAVVALLAQSSGVQQVTMEEDAEIEGGHDDVAP
ncbi:hypothetical protein ACOSP7_014531 [Xanthoceras sorbifolium]